MTPAFPTRRRADELEAALRASAADGAPGAGTRAEIAELTAVVAQLRSITAVSPRAEFAVDLRSRLMVAAETALKPSTSSPARAAGARPRRERRVAVAVGGFAVLSATASMSVAAQSSLPGDTLYPLKRVIENAHVGVQTDADGKGSTLLSNASGRLAEVDELSRGGAEDSSVIADTLDDFVAQATEASDLLLDDYAATGHASSLETLRDFTAQSMVELQQLRDLVPTSARDALSDAADLLSTIDQQALQACPSCTQAPLTALPEFAGATVPLLEELLEEVVPSSRSQESPKATTKHRDSGKQARRVKHTEQAPQQQADDTTPDRPTLLPPSAPDTADEPQDTDKSAGKDRPKSGLEKLGDALKGKGNGTTKGSGLADLLDDVDDALTGLLGGSDKGGTSHR